MGLPKEAEIKVTVRMPESLHQALLSEARANDSSLSWVIRRRLWVSWPHLPKRKKAAAKQ